MEDQDVRRLERALGALKQEITDEIAELRNEVRKAANFQVGFQAISKGLTYVCIIAAALATAYAAIGR